MTGAKPSPNAMRDLAASMLSKLTESGADGIKVSHKSKISAKIVERKAKLRSAFGGE